MTDTRPEPQPEPTLADLAAVISHAWQVVLPEIQAQVTEFNRTMDRLADAIDALNAAEHYRRTGRKPMPQPVARPKETPR